jgi:hypothetical protein
VLSLSVQGRRAGLLSQIEQDVLDDGKPIGSALRRCMLLGSRTGSSQLREVLGLRPAAHRRRDQRCRAGLRLVLPGSAAAMRALRPDPQDR